MIINHNLGSMSALSSLNANSNSLQSALEKLSSGKKINSAADDASGYAISQKMQGQINGLNQASQNAQDGISMIQTASGALNETTNLLQNMRQLAVQAANGTTTTSDRADLQDQFDQLASQINNIGNTTQFNTQNLLDGTQSADFQIGANTGQTMTLTIGDMRAQALKVTASATGAGFEASEGVTDGTNSTPAEYALDISSTTTAADSSISTLDTAIQTVTTQQAQLGAMQNRLQSTINNLGTSSQNLTTAQSGITDVDMASEMATFTQDNVLQQAAVSMLAQANQQPQLVLKLLG